MVAGLVVLWSADFGNKTKSLRKQLERTQSELAAEKARLAELRGIRNRTKTTADGLEQTIARMGKGGAKTPPEVVQGSRQHLAQLRGLLKNFDAELAKLEESRKAKDRLFRDDLEKLVEAPFQAPSLEASRDYLAEMRRYADKLSLGAVRDKVEAELRGKERDMQAMVYSSPILPTRLALLFKIMALVGTAVLVLFSWDEIPADHAAEYHGCLLIIAAGACLVGAANDLITLFLALELVSIPTYVILYLPRHDKAAQEAAIKYFLLSIFSSGLMLFGFSYLYGVTGTTNITALIETLSKARSALIDRVEPQTVSPPWQGITLIALVMIVAGLGFKITAVPFHFYAPDVYQGTTPGAAALLAFIPKVAGFAGLVRLLGFAPAGLAAGTGDPAGQPSIGLALGDQVPWILWIMAAVTMSLGNLLALLQNNVKRLLAYSSVAHAGYMLIGLAVAPRLVDSPGATVGGVDAVVFYLVGYGAMTIGAFAVLHYLSTPEQAVETVDDLAGVGRSHPGAALMMALFLFSLIGIPLTAGFAGKFLLFFDALGLAGPPDGAGISEQLRQQYADQKKWYLALAIIGVLNAAVAAYYYLRIVAVMYLREPLFPLRAAPRGPILAALGVCVALTLGLGVYPAPLLNAVRFAVPRRADVSSPATAAVPQPDRALAGPVP
jgi:NADH-quinone oxidoreductase subunit N